MFRLMLPALSLLLCTQSYTVAQNKNAITDVVIIGVNHQGNKVYNADTLIKALMLLKPDVILLETDTVRGYFKKDGKLVTNFGIGYKIARKLRIASAPSVEYTATINYLRQQPTAVHPFDKTIKRSRKYLREWNRVGIGFWNAVYYAQLNNEIPDHQNGLYDQLTFYERFLNRSINFPLWRMNNDTSTQRLREKLAFENKYFKQFIDSTPSLRSWSAAIQKDQKEWSERNNIMAQNILRYIIQYPGKRIVVLTGNLHRHHLLDLLSPQTAFQNFRLLNLYGETMSLEKNSATTRTSNEDLRCP